MKGEINYVNVSDIIPNRFQPRKNFNQDELQELAESIKQHGIIQPLVLRRLGDKYEIIAGERRFKAANIVGLREVPSIIMDLDDVKSAEIALAENIQRKDLTAIEKAKSYKQILGLGQMTQEELAKRMGKSQPAVSNMLRLLDLSDEVQQALLNNKISERHARSLLALKDNPQKQIEMLNQIIEKRMTVRETDLAIKEALSNNTNNVNNDDDIEEIIDFGNSNNDEFIIEDIPNNSTQNNEEEIGTISLEGTIDTPNDIKEQINNIPPVPSIPDFDQISINEPNNIEPINNENSNKILNLDDEEANMNMGNENNQNNFNNFMNIPDNVQPPIQLDGPPVNNGIEPVQDQNNFGNPNPQMVPEQSPMYQQPQQMMPQQQMYQYPNQQMMQNPNQMYQYPNQQPMVDPNMVYPMQQQMYQYPTQQSMIDPNIGYQPQPMQDPAFTMPQQQEQPQEDVGPQAMIMQQDITGAVAVIRNTIMNLQNNGYMIEINENDLAGAYQINISIRK
ncbi:MAG: ParB/RepB/Spo0J family partition protein [Bacilli bacterium]|nr:ParB/RepB/Spo0J family partition protein [Bacilli bacterium]